MKLLIKYIVFIIAFSISPELHAGLLKGMFNVRQIGHTEGLSSQRVFSIVEDKHSVIWIATKNGIDRYNGQSVKNYTLQGNFYYGDMAGRRIQLLYSQQYGLWAYDHTGRIYRYVAKQTVLNKTYTWVSISAEKSSSTNYVWILMGRCGLD